MNIIKLRFPSNKIEVEAIANGVKFAKIVPCIDGQFYITCYYSQDIDDWPMLKYYNTLQEAKDTCQLYFDKWVEKFIISQRTINLNKLV
jgi:hypothetical protein